MLAEVENVGPDGPKKNYRRFGNELEVS